ncbi:MAG: SAM-dependent methyltransferase [Vallitaleaceae bacterium]|nr:SAM-dependent methyltransferase [Vallitaleaceae bacterium]
MYRDFIEKQFNVKLHQIIISHPRLKKHPIKKVVIKPYLKSDQLLFQFQSYSATQVFHKNYGIEDALIVLNGYLDQNLFKQIDGFSSDLTWHALINKKGHMTLKKSQSSFEKEPDLSHDRQKKYLLPEGIPIPYLIKLGVMTEAGQVHKKKYDKFRQINRFLEMVEDVLYVLDHKERIKIIDFGCGKSYLTFALYHYLTAIKGKSVDIIGLDLKEKVIEDCNTLARACQYDHLRFEQGDIVDYESGHDIDMMVTLHACNTATDLALKKAVDWNAQVILSVPCCQHELNQQIHIEPLKDLLSYGIIKERVAALFTDAMRANWLKANGYEVQILEFIDMTHTPKNLLIRGIKADSKKGGTMDLSGFDTLQDYLGSDLTIRKL